MLLAKRTRVLVISGQHGDEKTPVLAMLNLIGKLAEDRADTGALRETIAAFITVANPDGFAASHRYNAAGVDLNRDWEAAQQPETAAVRRFVISFRPHVIIDLHEWSSSAAYRPDCVEAPSFGKDPAHKLARSLAGRMASSSGERLRLKPVLFERNSDRRLAHRWFTEQGISSLLIETSPDWSTTVRIEAYERAVLTALASISGRDPGVSSALAALRSQYPRADSAAADFFPPSRPHRASAGQAGCWITLIAAAAYIVIRCGSHSRARPIALGRPGRMPDIQRLTISEVVCWDMSVHARLELIRRHRPRPTDRK